ncbi:MAG: addiction module protein, partial [Candidatus Sulfotelmatobacter sp.]
MQFFPRDGHCLARFQVLDSTCHFLIPSPALANTLLDSLESRNESVQEAWDEEVARRIEDLKAGKAVTVPWEELHRELL